MSARPIASLILLLGSLPALAHTTEPDWPAFRDAFQERFFAYEPAFAVVQGRHEFDGKLPDWSADGIASEIAWLKGQQQAALKFDGKLDAEQAFEQQYLLARIDAELFWRDEVRDPFRNPAYYLNQLEPAVYLTLPYAPLATRMKAFTAYLQAIPRALSNVRANLETPMPRTFAELAASALAGYAQFYPGEAVEVFSSVDDAAAQAELKAAATAAAQAAQSLADWFEAQKAHATDKFALGEAQFSDMLWRTERVRMPIKELKAVAEADLKRNLDALKAACAVFAAGDSLADCMEKMNADKAQGGAVPGARAQLGTLRKFVVDQDLVTIPGPEQALVDEAPSYQRWNIAYINIPGPYDTGLPSTYYIAPPDPSWSPAEQEAYVPGKAGLEFTSVHEVWPGHFLQFLHSNRSSFRFGQLFVGYAFAEGWAHYTEEMMWDAGLDHGDAETHVGQLSEALLRNVRFLCAIGLHTEHMSVQTCETMFREQAFQDPGNARQQAARGTFDPAYLNYTMGKLMIRKLRADWTATRGGRKAWKAFHDRLLSYGGPPLPLVRAQMMGADDQGSLF